MKLFDGFLFDLCLYIAISAKAGCRAALADSLVVSLEVLLSNQTHRSDRTDFSYCELSKKYTYSSTMVLIH